ncbi:MAG: hypothetical protein OEZ15_10215 [Gammaproteobacteria bacterium]|nr:hypothetical protein [Gammaproteobacteria bacterium]
MASMFANKFNSRVVAFVMSVLLLLVMLVYFGLVYGFFSDATEKNIKVMRDLVSEMPELRPVMMSIEEDGRITQAEYWKIIDAYKAQRHKNYRKELGMENND